MKKTWIYVVKDSEGTVSYHKTLRSAKKRSDGKWHELPDYDDGPRRWQAGMTETYHVTIAEVRLWE